MKLGYIGLGKMGLNMVERLVERRHEVVVFDQDDAAMQQAAWKGAAKAQSIWNLVDSLERPRLIWLMVPHKAVDAVLKDLVPRLHDGDTIIDGGNSFYKDSERRHKEFAARDIYFLDAGVSGGPQGAREGACVMVGGDEKIFKKYETLFKDIAVENGYAHVGKSGAGHFVKMVHNGIEYGMMQSLAEGFAVLKNAPYPLNLSEVARLYNERSVIESRLVGWLKEAYEKHGEELDAVSGSVGQTGEGMWTAETAKEFGISVPVIETSVEFRKQSETNPSYIGKILSALRNTFGGHDVVNL
ncbi:MAG: 6-phosphogluconate dehydrogenase [Parcubacteria group bacterium Gr01-1014_29]|nr:MAG: 6-phosphogluconate dehydrogenase [Parcubacteria group bacterium Gr01-1014_29]